MNEPSVSPQARARNLARAAMHDHRADEFVSVARRESCPPFQYEQLMLAAKEARGWASAIRSELQPEGAPC